MKSSKLYHDRQFEQVETHIHSSPVHKNEVAPILSWEYWWEILPASTSCSINGLVNSLGEGRNTTEGNNLLAFDVKCHGIELLEKQTAVCKCLSLFLHLISYLGPKIIKL